MKKNNLIYARTCVYNVNYHIVWSTKYRKEVLDDNIQKDLKDLFLEIAKEKGFTIATMEIMPDHVHIAENLITYKAEDKGIKVKKQEESYTSQCSPYEEKISEKTAKRTNRKYRGLYIVNNKLLNADCVGAYNIMKKYLQRVGKPATAVVGLDTPVAYRWDFQRGFIGSTKLANSLAM
ncbi:MAG: putative transposase [Thermosediminibacterales bacterium]|nr:putative transposase [Thermosediminibacterales bacterium]MDK2836508.1 putative transposase [Thermosediminibacterales bacterium]